MNKIEFSCNACGTTLSVGLEHAGKKARCPKCSMVHDVPGDASAKHVASTHSSELPTQAWSGLWEMRSSDGQTYGPVEKRELDDWANEGRIPPNSYLRQQHGEWFPSEQIYPQLYGAHHATVINQPAYIGKGAGHYGHGANPFADSPRYSATQQFAAGNTSSLRPHNGATILTLGLMGVMCCGFFGLIAWIMGAIDLNAMKNGTMDTSGRSIVLAGYVLGIISVVLHGGVVLMSIFFNSF